eukprot:gene5932-8179_t
MERISGSPTSNKRTTSPPKPSTSPKKDVTRYGPIKSIDQKFGTEKRFNWQAPQFSSDVIYHIPDDKVSKSVIFGSSLRDTSNDNPDAKTRSNGPGSYDVVHCFDHLSEYVKKNGNRFPNAARQSMALKTPSPGAVYNIDNAFYMGPEKKMGIGFGNSSRQPLFNSSAGADADMFIPKYETGPAITISKRFNSKSTTSLTPGAVYDVHLKVNFKTGPAYSFGKGKGSRFKEVGFLPEL